MIIGSGCTGLTAAIYAARANLTPLVIDGHEPGGQLRLDHSLAGKFPRLPADGIMGPELIENMPQANAAKFGTKFKSGVITGMDLTRRPFKIEARQRDVCEAKALMIVWRELPWARLVGLPNERELMRARCLPPMQRCDGYFFPRQAHRRGRRRRFRRWKKRIFCRRYASRVYLIHRRNEFRASGIMIDRCEGQRKIEFVIPAVRG